MRLSKKASFISLDRPGWREQASRFRRSPELSLPHGGAMNADITKRGLLTDPFAVGDVVAIYCLRSSTFSYALKMLDEMPKPSTVAWNIAISTLFRTGACGAARALFDCMTSRNHVTCSAVIAGYSQNGLHRESLLAFAGIMRVDEASVSSPAVASAIAACGHLRDLRFGEQVHGWINKKGLGNTDEFVAAALVDMYGKCGCMVLASRVFDSMVETKTCVVAWSSLMANHLSCGDLSAAMEIFKKMTHLYVEPTIITLTTLISAYSAAGDLSNGKALHGFIIKREGITFSSEDDVYAATALIHMYHSCGSLSNARKVFDFHGDRKPTPLWNTMISGYAESRLFADAWEMIRTMCRSSEVWRLNQVTMATILPICARTASLLHGEELHCYAVKNTIDDEVLVGNALLDMYSKCGRMGYARKVFDKMPQRNCISWTSLIDGYGMNNDPFRTVEVFERMLHEGVVEPDPVTFAAVVSSCSRAGLVEQGLRYALLMIESRGVVLTKENYGCLVDLLARSGHTKEARKVVDRMPMQPGKNIWGALLGACRIHGEAGEAASVALHLEQLESMEGGFRSLLLCIYAEIGRLDLAAKIGSSAFETRDAKRKGCSWVQIKEPCRSIG